MQVMSISMAWINLQLPQHIDQISYLINNEIKFGGEAYIKINQERMPE